MNLTDKAILVISPQAWGTMFLAKHHYAIELAKRGNRVFFLNPPDQNQMSFPSTVHVKPSGVHPNLHLIEHKLFFPNWLRFKAEGLFYALMQFHVNKIKQQLPELDIIWSFDLGHYYPFGFWGKKAMKIYHPIDEPLNHFALEAAHDADVMFAVTREILEKYPNIHVPKHFIQHGVEGEFLEHANPEKAVGSPIHCGLSGNFTRSDLDRATLLRIVQENPEVMFECWGSYRSKDSNVGGGDSAELQQFIATLQSQSNIIMHGPVSPHVLAQELHRMDMHLICYDIQKDQSKGTNYHKIMEYLSTGRVVVSNNVTTYASRPDLVCMPAERAHNDDLPRIFKQVIEQVSNYNSPEKQRTRIDFARDNIYPRQLDRIEQCLSARS